MAVILNRLDKQSGPVGPGDRIEAIDALRGIALFGVLAINLVTEFRVSIFEQFLSIERTASPQDRAIERFLMLALDMKAFALFSLLFGVVSPYNSSGWRRRRADCPC